MSAYESRVMVPHPQLVSQKGRRVKLIPQARATSWFPDPSSVNLTWFW